MYHSKEKTEKRDFHTESKKTKGAAQGQESRRDMCDRGIKFLSINLLISQCRMIERSAAIGPCEHDVRGTTAPSVQLKRPLNEPPSWTGTRTRTGYVTVASYINTAHPLSRSFRQPRTMQTPLVARDERITRIWRRTALHADRHGARVPCSCSGGLPFYFLPPRATSSNFPVRILEIPRLLSNQNTIDSAYSITHGINELYSIIRSIPTTETICCVVS